MAAIIVGMVALVVLSGIPGLSEAYTPDVGTRQGELILKVGGQDEMKTRNLLPSIANDVWTSDVVFRAYGGVLLGHPTLDQPMAYIAKGVDFNENGVFEPAEYDRWAETAGATTPLEIVVYYDFNGVMWHDGKQMTPWDLFFSYHLNAMNARFNTDLRVLFAGGSESQYESGGRQLNIAVAAKNWQGESSMPGDSALRVAVKFTLNEPFALFYESTLSPVLLPMHTWSRTGGGRHADFGCAVWIPTAEATARGISECGTSDTAKHGKGIASTETVPGSRPYSYTPAETWEQTDQDVIGSGPFKFASWIPGVEARVVRNEEFYTGANPADPTRPFDATLARILKKPTIDGIRFLVYRTTQLGVFALQSNDIDYYHWNVGAEFVPDLLKNPNIAVESNAEPGFFYLAYNLRREPWGYRGGNPTDDVGWVFRQAVSHLIDKRAIVQNLLQNFGVIGHGVISPANTFWYNDLIPKPEFDLNRANSWLDSPEARAVGISAKGSGPCAKETPSGCRSLGARGTQFFEILTPQADYDPVRASAGAMVADAMRQVGINAVSKPTAFGAITQAIDVRGFDLYILGWRIGGTDPDYLFSFFDSSNAPSGQNYPGFNNATFDTVVRASRAELDRNQRQQYVFQAQQILAEARPYDVLYYRTNIEGYRQDRFVNWTVSSGSLWGFWSLQGIRPPSAVSLRASIVMESATSSGRTEPVTIKVLDHQGVALSGASVNVSVDAASLANVTIGACSKRLYCTGTTDLNGQVVANVQMPQVTAETPVVVTARATHPQFPDPSSRSAVIRVFPPGAQFLSLRFELPVGDRVTAGSALPMSLGVRDQDRALVGDAAVTITVDPPGGLLPNPDNGTAANMAQITLTASSTVTTETPFEVTVTATKGGYTQATARIDIIVTPVSGGTKLCPDGSRVPVDQDCPTVQTPGFDLVIVLAAIGTAALIAGVVIQRKRRS